MTEETQYRYYGIEPLENGPMGITPDGITPRASGAVVRHGGQTPFFGPWFREALLMGRAGFPGRPGYMQEAAAAMKSLYDSLDWFNLGDGEKAPAPEPVEEKTLVFVYGTLMQGEPNHRVLAGAHFAGKVKTRGNYGLYDLGAFPAMSQVDVVVGQPIHGEVYEVDADTLLRLDRLEGHPNFYQRERILLPDLRWAQTYTMPRDRTRGRPRIRGADWRKYQQRKLKHKEN